MKFILVFSLLFVSAYLGQAQNVARDINFRTIDKDSVSLPLNDKYYLIEDSCAQIIRTSRFNFGTGKFYGKFTDVSKANPALIVAEGAYTADGLKNGSFKTHYLNGNLQAKGDFKNDKYDGKWEIYYEDEKPELKFEAINGDCRIIDAWNSDGEKAVENGVGVYIDNLGSFYWMGKLLNGKPDGMWKLLKTGNTDNESLATEYFKNGQFHDGSNGNTDYSDRSRIDLLPSKLPFVNAEKMRVSPVPYKAEIQKNIVNAQYKDGLKVFTSYISDAVLPYMRRLYRINAVAEISGEISENGTIINLDYQRPDIQDIARGLSVQLRNLPRLQPATVNGKPVKQKFTISFRIHNNSYDFSYRFLPIQVN